jgi:SAM-dependent methyltransferase
VSEFDVFARYYDLDFENENDDIDFFRSFAQRSGSPVLEIGVGTGRVAIPLAKDGLKVTGLDISPAMLQTAHTKASEAKITRNLKLVEADARDFKLEQRFAMAFVAANSFMHFVDAEDQMAVLQAIHEHLNPGGLIVIDVFNPSLYVSNEPDGVVIHDYTRKDPHTGNTVMKFETRQIDHARQMIDVQFFYDELNREGAVHRLIAPFAMHYFSYHELTLLLTKSGFAIEQVYGSYELDDYHTHSSRMIFVAAKEEYD